MREGLYIRTLRADASIGGRESNIYNNTRFSPFSPFTNAIVPRIHRWNEVEGLCNGTTNGTQELTLMHPIYEMIIRKKC